MTSIQICALISIVIALGILYWAGYKGGFIDGRAEGQEEGKAIQQSDSSETIRNLELLLDQARNDYKRLHSQYKRALAASKLGEPARHTLLDIAEKLRIAAATFSALRTGKRIARDSLMLRDQALAMVALLEPVAPEQHQTEAGHPPIESGPSTKEVA
ncbi:hypothetical protein [Pseudomonas lurida]|uniref:hypothetical protein n=1 Tax=Pseudomonas lurida TaxID=244566 RepID=UPI0030DD5331